MSKMRLDRKSKKQVMDRLKELIAEMKKEN